MANYWRLIGYLRPYLGRIVLGAILLGIAGALMSAVVATMKPLVNEVLTPPEVAAVMESVEDETGSAPADANILTRVRDWLPEEALGDWLRDALNPKLR